MAYPQTFDNLSQPSPTTVRSAVGGISPANTVAALIRSLQTLEYRIGLSPTAVTFTADASTDTITSSAHGLADNDILRFTSTETLPSGLVDGTSYFVISATTNTFQVATTRGGSAVDITTTGTGTHSFTVLFSESKVLTSLTDSQSTWTNALNLGSGSLVLPQSTSAAPTAEGSMAWDTDDDLLKVGTGAATKTMLDTNSTQTATNKSLTSPTITGTVGGSATYTTPTLSTPAIANFNSAQHDHTTGTQGGQLPTAAHLDASITASKLATGAATSNITTSETTTSASYADLATVQSVSVTVGANGLLLVGWGCQMNNSAGNGNYSAPALSGSNTYAATDNDLLYSSGATPIGHGRVRLFSGLSTGATTVTLKFKVDGGTGTFQRRHLWAVPL